MKQKITPWVDISCGMCGGLAAHSGFYYRGIITALQKETKDWVYEDGINYCPDCWKRHLEDKEAIICIR